MKLDIVFPVRLTAQDRQGLKEQAAREETTESAIVRRLIRALLAGDRQATP